MRPMLEGRGDVKQLAITIQRLAVVLVATGLCVVAEGGVLSHGDIRKAVPADAARSQVGGDAELRAAHTWTSANEGAQAQQRHGAATSSARVTG